MHNHTHIIYESYIRQLYFSLIIEFDDFKVFILFSLVIGKYLSFC